MKKKISQFSALSFSKKQCFYLFVMYSRTFVRLLKTFCITQLQNILNFIDNTHIVICIKSDALFNGRVGFLNNILRPFLFYTVNIFNLKIDDKHVFFFNHKKRNLERGSKQITVTNSRGDVYSINKLQNIWKIIQFIGLKWHTSNSRLALQLCIS